ncbi:single-stranded DNA-binding protein 1 [Halolactibacillus alkaliphilus]|uniref:Single-stranded DNA-binding protein n=1 Tax=Halolactibacillus alkaliphilus TaxID=442899 RepID=A0A511X0E4_9BACI|nr:single-stranded DNA-binding protein [Halolactibacillus alkaliphilus]GEN56426.1 single-stranded DNA-binding protein 1 [Halolactibacillus alkaliphilus]GGN64507.1 single-stranded DNA-binding protein 1 [Halolactibacillus alkaliphilus]SFO60987.1 single-strand binding protein [Halolactibacillus alkaliphilus]
MLNRVVLVGRLTKDPDLRYTASGVAVANFTIAVNRPFSNQQGEREADFINCVIWRKPAENLANYMGKGSLIGVDGRIQTRSYDNQDGQRVYVTEIVADSVQFLESRNSKSNQSQGGGQGSGSYQDNQYQNQQQAPSNNQYSQPTGSPNDSMEPIDISDDDLPF